MNALSISLVEYNNICGGLHSVNSVTCDFTLNLTLYISLILGAIFGWKLKQELIILALLIPIPMFIGDLVDLKQSGSFNLLRPDAINLLQVSLV